MDIDMLSVFAKQALRADPWSENRIAAMRGCMCVNTSRAAVAGGRASADVNAVDAWLRSMPEFSRVQMTLGAGELRRAIEKNDYADLVRVVEDRVANGQWLVRGARSNDAWAVKELYDIIELACSLGRPECLKYLLGTIENALPWNVQKAQFVYAARMTGSFYSANHAACVDVLDECDGKIRQVWERYSAETPASSRKRKASAVAAAAADILDEDHVNAEDDSEGGDAPGMAPPQAAAAAAVAVAVVPDALKQHVMTRFRLLTEEELNAGAKGMRSSVVGKKLQRAFTKHKFGTGANKETVDPVMEQTFGAKPYRDEKKLRMFAVAYIPVKKDAPNEP